MNTAYKHLDAKLRIAELTIGQWIGLFAGVMVGIFYSFYLKPFGTTLTLFTGVYVAGVPICAVFLANMSDFDLGLLISSALSFRRTDGRYLAGPGAQTPGYRLIEDGEVSARDARDAVAELDVEALWGER